MTEINIIHADAVKWAKEYTGPKFHALLCDPPYHLTSIVKRFGKGDSAPAQFGKDGAFSRASRGFLGQIWDGGDVAFQPDTWAAFGEVLYPGAFGMAFASSRGWHRLAVAIEDAGFIIHPSIFGWVYSSGFPKATRVKDDERFKGHRYGLQALKPALEPIIVFQKPYDGRPLDNITQTGAGTLNINAGRIGNEEIPSNQWLDNAHPFGNGAGNEYKTEMNTGRWPANFVLMDPESAEALDRQSGHLISGNFEDHHVITSEFPFGGGERSQHPQAASYGDAGGASRFFYQVADKLDESDPVYYCAKPGKDEKEAGLNSYLTIKYNKENLAKEISLLWQDENMELAELLKRVMSEVGEMQNLSIAESGESIMVLFHRDFLSTIKTTTNKITESKISNWLMRLPTNEFTAVVRSGMGNGGKSAQSVKSGKKSTKKTGISQKKDGFHITDVAHAMFGLLSKISNEENWQIAKPIHPTHKPIDLSRYLASLLLPPAEYGPRRLFVPFSGVASEVIGGMQARWDEITGVELTAEYIPIAQARIEYWRAKGVQIEMF